MFSLLLRRAHMYLALFLAPWMLMYASSTLAMNHRRLFGAPAAFEKERELVYDGVLPDGGEPRVVSAQLLDSLGLSGAHNVTLKDGVYVINRTDLVTPRRLTYTPADRRVVVEKLPLRANAFLERFHRRRGYATGYGWDTAWAVSVDLAVAAMIFWSLSGLWMWWELKATRGFGLLALLGGAGLFTFYLLAI